MCWILRVAHRQWILDSEDMGLPGLLEDGYTGLLYDVEGSLLGVWSFHRPISPPTGERAEISWFIAGLMSIITIHQVLTNENPL